MRGSFPKSSTVTPNSGKSTPAPSGAGQKGPDAQSKQQPAGSNNTGGTDPAASGRFLDGRLPQQSQKQNPVTPPSGAAKQKQEPSTPPSGEAKQKQEPSTPPSTQAKQKQEPSTPPSGEAKQKQEPSTQAKQKQEPSTPSSGEAKQKQEPSAQAKQKQEPATPPSTQQPPAAPPAGLAGMKNEFNQVNWQQYEQDRRAVASGTPVDQLSAERRANLERGDKVVERFAKEREQLERQLERQDQTRKEVEQLHQESIKERDRAVLLGKIGSAGLGVIYSADALAHAAEASPFAAARAVGSAWNFGRGVGDKIVGVADSVSNLAGNFGFGTGAGSSGVGGGNASGGNAPGAGGASAQGGSASASGGSSGNASPPAQDARARIGNTVDAAQAAYDAREIVNDLRGMPQLFKDTVRGNTPDSGPPGAVGRALGTAQAGLSTWDAIDAARNGDTRQAFEHAGKAVVHAAEGFTRYGDNVQSGVNALQKFDQAFNTTDPNERRLLGIEAFGHTLGTAQGISPLGSAGQSIVSGTEAYRQFQEFNELSAYSRSDPSAAARQRLERTYQENLQMLEMLRRYQTITPGPIILQRP